MSKHFISLDEAKKMTKKFREEKEKVVQDEYKNKDILPICETFERSLLEAILAQPECNGVRAYYAMDEELKLHLVLVGVNEKSEDLLPSEASELPTDSTATLSNPVIVITTVRCPTLCPTASALNQ